jgi:cell wall-associated NlpC family hydrolase
MLGTQPLQAAINKFAASVDKLAALYAKQTGAVGGGSGFTKAQASAMLGGPSLPASGPSPAAAGGGGFMSYLGGMFQMVTGIKMQPGATQSAGAGGNGGGATFSGASSAAAASLAQFGTPGYTKQMSANVQKMGGAMGATAAVLSAGSMLAGYGASQMQTQVAMSGFTQQQALLGGTGFMAIQAQAFGSNNRGLPSMALNVNDAIQGQSIINSVGGTAANIPGSAGAYFRAATGGTGSFSYANPMGGRTQAAQMSSQMFSPQFSLGMMQSGYGNTPLSINGKGPQMNSAGTLQQIIKGLFASSVGKINSQGSYALGYQLRSGSTGQQDLESIVGNNPATVQAWTSALLQQNKLTQGNASVPGLNATQSQALLSQATGGGPGQNAARTTLARYGINESDLTKTTSAGAVKIGRSSDLSGAFNQGLSAATTGLTKFEEVLTNIVNLPVIHQLVGTGGGALGGVTSGLGGGGLAGLGSLGVQALMLRRMTGLASGGSAAGGLLSGEGGAGLGLGTSVSGLAEGAAGAAGAGSLLTLAAPVAVAMLAAGIGKAVSDGITTHDPHSRLAHQITSISAQQTKFNNQVGSHIPVVGGLLGGAANMVGDITNPLAGAIGTMESLIGGWFDEAWHSSASAGKGGSPPGTPVGALTRFGGASGGTSASGSSKNTTIPAASSEAVAWAEQQLGKPYIWGGIGPQGFDCSGLVMEAYQHSGISLPRTAAEQWAALQKKSVPLDAVEEGDIVFQAGAFGTFASPGHEAMMINNNQIVEAEGTGIPIHIRAYSDKEWQHAARPRGGLGSVSTQGGGGGGTGTTTEGDGGMPASSAAMGMGLGDYGSSEEVDDVSSALGGGGGGGYMSQQQLLGSGTPMPGTGTSPGAPSGGGGPGSTAQGGTAAKNRAIGQKLAAKYGWGSGGQWAALDWLWGSAEDNWDNTIWNGGSHAASQPAGSSGAYGIAQALPYTKYPKAGWPPGAGGTADAGAQETWGLSYIKETYHNPENAKAFHLAHNWYANGISDAPPGMAWVGERGAELMRLHGGEDLFPAAVSQHIAKMQNTQQPAQAPWSSLLDSSPSASPSGGGGIAITFEPGSIVIGHGENDKHAAKHLVDEICRELEQRELLATVTSGQKYGSV